KLSALVAGLLAALLCTAALFGCSGNQADNSSANSGTSQVKQKVAIGYNKNNFTEDKTFFDGADYNLIIKPALEKLNWDAEFKALDFSDIEKSINDGTVDCYWNSYTIQGREELYTWSEPYVKAIPALVYKKSNRDFGVDTTAVDLSTLSALPSNKIIGIQTGSKTYADMSPEQKKTLESIGTFKEFSGYSQCKDALNAGEIDMVLTETMLIPPLFEDANTYSWVRFAPMDTNTYGVAFKKGSEDKAQSVSAAIKDVYTSGTLKSDWFDYWRKLGRDQAAIERNWQSLENSWLLK
ncbi:MAG: transporter substrate-binding domain-containing protein, partial [Enterococcus sp.]|nr:transporter substrate-binding domain-containing protein [Enterococcus sp.]